MNLSWVIGYGVITVFGAILLFVAGLWVEGVVGSALAAAIFVYAIYVTRGGRRG